MLTPAGGSASSQCGLRHHTTLSQHWHEKSRAATAQVKTLLKVLSFHSFSLQAKRDFYPIWKDYNLYLGYSSLVKICISVVVNCVPFPCFICSLQYMIYLLNFIAVISRTLHDIQVFFFLLSSFSCTHFACVLGFTSKTWQS